MLIVLLFILAVAGRSSAGDDEIPIIDLRRWDRSTSPLIEVRGDWAVSWRRFVEPSEAFPQTAKRPNPGEPQVGWDGLHGLPSTWNEWRLDGEPVGGLGYATYAATVLLPPGVSEIGMIVPNASTAYRLWTNGRLVAQSGSPGTSPATTTPAYRIRSVEVAAVGGRLDLVLHVANFHHRRGGMWRPLRLGTPDAVSSGMSMELVYDLFLAGCFVAMAVYNLQLFWFGHRRRFAPLFLAAILVSLAVRILVVGQMVVTMVWQGIPWELQIRIEYLTGHLALAAFVQFFRLIYPRVIPRSVATAVTVFAAANAVLAVATSVLFYSRLVPYYGYAMVAVIAAVAVVLLVRAARGMREAWVGGAAAFLTLLIALGEQLHYQEILLSREFSPLAFVIGLVGGARVNETAAYIASASLNVGLLFAFTSMMVIRGSRSLLRAARIQADPPAAEPPIDAERLLRNAHGLTSREAEIVALVARGMTNVEIAEALYISVATVKTHVYRIMQKLDATSRHEVSRRFLELAWGRATTAD